MRGVGEAAIAALLHGGSMQFDIEYLSDDELTDMPGLRGASDNGGNLLIDGVPVPDEACEVFHAVVLLVVPQ